MTSLILLDDDRNHTQWLRQQLERIIERETLDAQVVLCAAQVQEALDYTCSTAGRAVYFLDIELGLPSDGIDVCQKIHQIDPDARIVYVSAYQHYALQCLRSHAFDFLLKPFTEVDLSECLRAVLLDLERQDARDPLLIRLGSRALNVDQMDISHFTIVRNQLTAHTRGEYYTWRGSFPELMRSLKPGLFLQVHRSCLVNVKRIGEVDWAEDRLITDEGVALPIARRAKRALRSALQIRERVDTPC